MRVTVSIAPALLYALPALTDAPPAGVRVFLNSPSVWESLPLSEAEPEVPTT